ncbi:BglG family transcription antiterminator [Aerococcus urinaeequi]|uniref:BglG family transcription antiterminator n=1 Tax=Aerococcus urinaeequi TaxID=51665 RepID=UPI00288E1CA8|nr:PTS sugar transporter subunit IIA [Aerococcus urinaeequi]MDT2762304.1 PTS sugar transporter subunit IIA [Aerococcus urinaeequi]
MLSDRASLLLQILLTQEYINLKSVSELFNVSERTIRNDLEEINDFLETQNLPKLTKEINTSFKLEASKEKIRSVLEEVKEQKIIDIDVWQSPSARQATIYRNIFNEKEQWTIEKIEQLLKVSRSTVINDIKEIRKKLKKYNIKFIFDSQCGFLLQGDEFNIREYYFNESDYLNINYYNSKEYTDNKDELNFLIKWLETIEKKLHKQLSIDGLFKLVFSIKTSIYRLLKGHSLDFSYYQNMAEYIRKDEFSFIKKHSLLIESFYKITIPNQELIYIVQKFNQATLLNDELINEGYKLDLEILVNNFVKIVGEKLSLDISADEELSKALALHFQKTIMKSNMTDIEVVDEGILAYIKTSYSRYYEIVKQVVNEFPEMVNLGFTKEEEIAFLTIHIVSTIEKMKNNYKKNLNVLVVCHLGIGTSQFLKYRLAEYFNFQVSTSAKSLLIQDNIDLTADIDFIITTVKLNNDTIPEINVSPSLNEVDIEKIKSLEEQVINEKINNKFNGRYEPMLKELLTDETIELNQTANNWQEAIRIGGNVLKNKGIVEETYIDAMIAAVEEFGPYIVIAPNIALAHASSKEGVNEIGLSLITLEEGVEFGSKENDPVKIVLCLAATDHNTHLKALSELVNILDDKKFIDSLMQGNKDKVLEIINTQK